MKNSKNGLMYGLFFFYLIVVVWIILFKMQFYFSDLPHMRSINLIPFEASIRVGGRIDYSEIIGNFLIFVPFGFFLEFLWQKKHTFLKLCSCILFSVVLEAFQFFFSIGATDITDVLMNSFGGISGLIFTKILYFTCRNHVKLTVFLHYFVIFCSIVCSFFLFLLVFFNI